MEDEGVADSVVDGEIMETGSEEAPALRKNANGGREKYWGRVK